MKWPLPRVLPVVGVLAVAMVIAYFPTGGEEPATEIKSNSKQLESNSPRATSAQQQPQLGRIELERLKQQKAQAEEGKTVSNAFKTTSWYIAPPRQADPPPPPPPPAPVPTAPQLPFSYFGRYEDPPKRLVILAIGSKLYTVSEGEVIDGTYRVDRITDKSVDLVYLPLNIIQSISTIGVPDNTQHRNGAEELNRRP